MLEEIKPWLVPEMSNIVERPCAKIIDPEDGVAVCKKSIWYENPPAAALSGNGTYQLTIKLKMENYASTDEHHWSFITELGLGVG